jgi:hypothetical protein
MTDYAFDDPHSELVALRGGPRDHRWLYYRDWIAARCSSRRLRVPLDRPDGASRCYAPTTTFTHQHTKSGNELTARVWTYLPPQQWRAWGSEYRTPEEHHDPYETLTPPGDVTSQSHVRRDIA